MGRVGGVEGVREPHERDWDALVDWLLGFAEHMLRTTGGFAPFCAGVDPDGEIVAVAVAMDEPVADLQVRDELRVVLERRAAEGSIRASGIAVATVLRDPSTGVATGDAVCFHLDHEDADAVDVVIPYRMRPRLWRREVQWGEAVVEAGTEEVFGGG